MWNQKLCQVYGAYANLQGEVLMEQAPGFRVRGLGYIQNFMFWFLDILGFSFRDINLAANLEDLLEKSCRFRK